MNCLPVLSGETPDLLFSASNAAIHNKLVVGILTMALAVWGVWSLLHLPFDATPDITNNQVQVITLAPRLGAQEVEQYITTPVEMALANVPRVEERRSISRSGLSVITLVFDDAADIYWARSTFPTRRYA